MERDFLGLNSRNVSEPVRGEITDAGKDSATVRGSTMFWSFSNKVSALPQFLSFKAAQEDKSRKTGYDSLTSTGYMTISNSEAFDPNHKSYTSTVQKNWNLDNQAGTRYLGAAYPLQHFDPHRIYHPHEVKILPIANQTNQMISGAANTAVNHSFLASAGQNGVVSSVNPQILGVSAIAPVSIVPTPSSIVGTTDLRNAPKTSGNSAQLTIFYAGSVCVYDDISPEKARAIMLLARNGPPVAPNATATVTTQVQAPMSRPSVSDGLIGNQSHNELSCPALPSPISMTSHAGPQSAAGSNTTNEVTAVKSIALDKPEPSKVVSSLGSAPTTFVPSAVPQARKASLARFLEKRKERVIAASPYVSKQSPDGSPPKSEGVSFSGNRQVLPLSQPSIRR